MKKIKKNDEVIIITGKFKNKTGKVLKVDYKKSKIIVSKINEVKKHRKPTQTNQDGGIVTFEAPIDISNVKHYDKKKQIKKNKEIKTIKNKDNK